MRRAAARAARAATPTPAAARPPAPPRRAVDRESGYKLPMGPVFTTTHTSTLSALREELGGASRLFKERQLGAIAACFGGGGGRGTGGLYAGFGNKDKDVYAYVAAGIEPRHTFLIDPASTIQICPECALRAPPAADAPPGTAAAAGDSTAAGGRAASYSGLQPLAEVLFPPHCSEGERVQVAARFAAIAAQHLPNGFSKAASQKKLSSSAAPTPELAGAARQAAVEAV